MLDGELCDFVWHSRREKKRLARLWHLAHDFLNLWSESNIEHVVSLVQNENRYAVEFNISLFEVVDEASWRRDDDRRTASKLLDLSVHRIATNENG